MAQPTLRNMATCPGPLQLGSEGPRYMGLGSTLSIDWSPHRNTLPSSVPHPHPTSPWCWGLGCGHSSLSLWKCGHVQWGPQKMLFQVP